MEEKSTVTLEKIQQAAMEEFSEKGFQGASLRQIVKQARCHHRRTLWLFLRQGGAFCLHCGTSRRRADGPVYGGADNLCRIAGGRAAVAHGDGVQPVRPLDGGLHLRPQGAPVKLLLCKAEGTSYECFVHNIVEIEVEYTLQYLEVLHRLGYECPKLDEQLCHIIASGMFNGIFEIVIHDMPKEQAMRYVDQLRDFLHRRMAELIGQS